MPASITLGQIDSTADVERNLGVIGRAVACASGDGPSVIVFPEYAMYEKKVVDATFASVAEPVDGAFGQAISDLADRFGLGIVVGMVELNPLDPERPFNTVAVFGPDGSLLGRHRKFHLYEEGPYPESTWIARPDEPGATVVDVAGRRLGLMACNDLRFPGLGMRLAADGADVVAVCASWVPGPQKVEQWSVLARARAVEHGYAVVAVSQAEPISIGNSLIATHEGVISTRLGGAPELRTAPVPPARPTRSAQRQPLHQLVG